MKQTKNNVLSLLGIIAGMFAVAFVTVSCTPEVKAQEPDPVPTTYTVTYITEHDSAPTTIEVEENTILSAEQLPELSEKDFVFKGWYDGDVKAVPGEYEVKGNVKLTAHWNMIKHALKKVSTTQTTNGSSYVNIQEYENNSKGQIAKITTTTTSNGTESVSESTYEYEYNDNGDLVKITTSSDSGVVLETEYNEHGDIVKTTTINNGEIINTQNTEYDSNYYIIKSTIMMYSGTNYLIVTEYENNSKGLPVKTTQTTTYNGNETVTVTVNEYNAHGDVVKKTSYSNNKIILTYVYEYDSNYYLTKETTYSGEELTDTYNIVTEYENNSNGKPLTVTNTTTINGAKSVNVTAYEYNEDGKMTKCTLTSSGSDYIGVTDSEYNEHGDIKKTTSYLNGEISSMSTYEYEDIEI